MTTQVLRRSASPPAFLYRSLLRLFARHSGDEPDRLLVDAVPPGLRRDVGLAPDDARPRLAMRPWL